MPKDFSKVLYKYCSGRYIESMRCELLTAHVLNATVRCTCNTNKLTLYKPEFCSAILPVEMLFGRAIVDAVFP